MESCGQGKTGIFENDEANVVYRQKRFENATCGRGFFGNGRKNLPFQKYWDTCGRGLSVMLNVLPKFLATVALACSVSWGLLMRPS